MKNKVINKQKPEIISLSLFKQKNITGNTNKESKFLAQKKYKTTKSSPEKFLLNFEQNKANQAKTKGNEKITTLINLYQVSSIYKQHKEKKLFSLGYPYFLKAGENKNFIFNNLKNYI